MRKVAMLAAAVLLGSGMAVVGGSAAQAARTAVYPPRTICYTTMPVPQHRHDVPHRRVPNCGGWHTARGWFRR